MQEKEIIINGDKFVAQKLAPNINDNDETETKDGKKFDYDTHKEIIVQCPTEPLLNVSADCLKKCNKCLIKENGGLYNGPCGYID